MTEKFTLLTHTANLALLTAAIPLGGWMGDHVGRRSLLVCCAMVTAATAYPTWMLVAADLGGGAWLGQMLLVVGAGLFIGGSTGTSVRALPRGVGGINAF